MDRTVRFETYSRIVPAVQYDGSLEAFAAINAFTTNKAHLRYGAEPVFMTSHGLVQLKVSDWVIEIAGNHFVVMTDEMRKAVFCPRMEDPLDEDTYGDFETATQTYRSSDAGDANMVAIRNSIIGVATTDIERGDLVTIAASGFQSIPHNPVANEMINMLGMDFARDSGDPVVPRYSEAESDPYVRVFGIDTATDQGDYTAIMIKPDHPHHKLINGILSLTGVDAVVRDPFTVYGVPVLAEGLPYEVALVAMKAGYRVAREGWNGKGMWICMGEGRMVSLGQLWNKHTKAFAEERWVNKNESTEVQPYILMKTADDKICMGWLASQMDQFATDWCILEN